MTSVRQLPEIALQLKPATASGEAAIGFRWADGNIGLRSKIGGLPNWIQGEEIPICSCGNPMSFYGQLDSVGDSICIADCGMIYTFVCFDCFTSASVLQSY